MRLKRERAIKIVTVRHADPPFCKDLNRVRCGGPAFLGDAVGCVAGLFCSPLRSSGRSSCVHGTRDILVRVRCLRTWPTPVRFTRESDHEEIR